MPACFRMALAVKRDLILESTVKFMFVFGLYQMSWSPLPCRTKTQLLSLSSLMIFFSNVAIWKTRQGIIPLHVSN